MSAEEIKKSLEQLQKEYNQLCGISGHIHAQINDLKSNSEEVNSQVKVIIKKVKSLQANMPKEEAPKVEEGKVNE